MISKELLNKLKSVYEQSAFDKDYTYEDFLHDELKAVAYTKSQLILLDKDLVKLKEEYEGKAKAIGAKMDAVQKQCKHYEVGISYDYEANGADCLICGKNLR